MVATPTENKTEVETSHLLGNPATDLRLRVCTGSRHGLVVRIATDRCTIGSARQCTLRLRHRQASPIHCLIVRGALGTLVRRWSPDTLLNGAPFHDAALRSGDRLRCGPLELEVLPQEPTPSATDSAAAGDTPPPPDGASAEIEAFRARAQLARNRSRRLVMAVRAARGRCVQLEWQLEEEQNKHRTTQSRFDQQRQDAAQQVEAATDQIDGLGEQLEQSQTARNELQCRLGADQNVIHELRERVIELCEQLAELKESQAAAVTEQAAAEGTEQPNNTESETAETDVSRETILAATHEDETLRDERSCDGPSADQRSIESYMADLLKRVSGSSVQQGHAENMAAVAESRVVREQVPTEEDCSPGSETTAAPSVTRPRRPEERTNLVAMRELAKLSADQAIDQHVHQHRFLKAVGKLTVAAAGLASGSALIGFSLLQAPDRDVRLPRLLGTVAVFIGVVWGLQGTVLMRKVRKRQPEKRQQPQPPVVPSD
ncbi:MAG: FHA domain-containing protein [Pirellulales bacterium]